jgi:hypothetical protein
LFPKFEPINVSVAPPLLAELNGVMLETIGALNEYSVNIVETNPDTEICSLTVSPAVGWTH